MKDINIIRSLNTKFILLFLSIGINCFSQEKVELLDIIYNIKSDLDYEFIEPTLYDKKERGLFNFEEFQIEKGDTKNEFHDVFYNTKKEIVKISRYCEKGYSHLDNYDLLIKSYPTYNLFTKCYFKNKDRDFKEAFVDGGFYLYDKIHKKNYFLKFAHYEYEPLVFENEKGEVTFESIILNKNFSLKSIASIFLLDKNLNGIKEIKWFNGGLEFFYEYSFDKEKKEVNTKISFYSAYRCDKEILLKNLKIKNLYMFFEIAPQCSPSYILNEKKEYDFQKSIWRQ